MEAPPKDVLAEVRLVIQEARSLSNQGTQLRAESEVLRLDVRTQVAISRERRAQRARLTSLTEPPHDGRE